MNRGLFGAVRAALALALALGVPALATSCQSLADIEDRELGQCNELCDTVMANCKGDDQVYETKAKCMGVCKLLDPGDPNDPEPQGQNTIACRLSEARFAANEGSENRNTHCRSAGPEGLNCGGSCENYCTLYERACKQVQCGSHENCVAKCPGVRNEKSFGLVDNYEGNSLQCRFVHLSNATLAPTPHCGHGQLQSPTLHCDDLPKGDEGEGGGTGTSSSVVDEPRCSDYCRMNMVACGGGPDAQYESDKQCLALCSYFEQGAIADKVENTLGCRLYHSSNALCDPKGHCPHAGPGGEGHCGTMPEDKCRAYCHLASGICPTTYASSEGFDGDDDKCLTDCLGLEDSAPMEPSNPATRYNVNYAATPNTLACRFLALSRAALDGKDSELCGSSAFGRGDCAP